MNPRHTLVICEDHPIYANGIEDFLKNYFHVSGKFNNGKDTLNFLKENATDFLLLDLNMEKMNGIEVVQELKKLNNKVGIVIISMYNDKILIDKCKKLGVLAYCNKQVANNELLEILNTVKINTFLTDSSLTEKYNRSNLTLHKEDFEKKLMLTKRELELVSLFAEGKSNNDIANQLNVSSFTIDTHKKNIFRKLEINTTVELVKFYYENF